MQTKHLVAAATLSALYATCAGANVCKVPGTTMQWVTDRCMLEHDTSEPNLEVVRQCVQRSGAQPQVCELNIVYKTAYCKVLAQKGKYKGPTDACVADPKVTGSYVNEGGVSNNQLERSRVASSMSQGGGR